MKTTEVIRQKEAKVIFDWLKFKAHEVDITKSDIEVLQIIAPLLPGRYEGEIERITKLYEQTLTL